MRLHIHGVWADLPWYITGATVSRVKGHDRMDFRILRWFLVLLELFVVDRSLRFTRTYSYKLSRLP